MKRYPFRCPNCASIKGMELLERDNDDDTYSESWECTECLARWECEFELVAVTLVDVD